jgi:hypothetical protein
MLRDVLALLPQAIVNCPLETAIAFCALGALLWMIGGRLSRSILALVAVAGGTIIGLRLPQWQGWQIDGMGLAVAGAIVLGSIAFLMHRTCIGLLLGIGMMLWAGFGTWVFMAEGASWNWRAATWHGDLVQYLHDLWQTLPPGMGQIFPWVCFAGFASGVTITVFSPKLGKVMAHSLIGVTLMALMGAIAASAARPSWLAALPGSRPAQGLALVGLVLLGVLIQWRLTPPHRGHGNVGRATASAGTRT